MENREGRTTAVLVCRCGSPPHISTVKPLSVCHYYSAAAVEMGLGGKWVRWVSEIAS